MDSREGQSGYMQNPRTGQPNSGSDLRYARKVWEPTTRLCAAL